MESEWRKSSRSGSGGGNCVETKLVWHKSGRSNGASMCVEVAMSEGVNGA